MAEGGGVEGPGHKGAIPVDAWTLARTSGLVAGVGLEMLARGGAWAADNADRVGVGGWVELERVAAVRRGAEGTNRWLQPLEGSGWLREAITPRTSSDPMGNLRSW